MTELFRKRLKVGGTWAAGVVLACLMLRSTQNSGRKPPPRPPPHQAVPAPNLQLERIGRLAPVHVHVTDVLEAEGDGYRGAWLIKGDALIVCDLARAKLIEADPAKHTARVQLPPPQVSSARVDFAKTKTWSVNKTTWLPWSAGDQNTFRDAAMLHAQRLIEDTARSDVSLDAARVQTELIIEKFYEAVGWKITVQWLPAE